MTAKNHRKTNCPKSVQEEKYTKKRKASASTSSTASTSITPTTTAKNTKLNYLANLPDGVNLLHIDERDGYDVFITQPAQTHTRICPLCKKDNCVIKDSGSTVNAYHISSAYRRGCIVTLHKRRFLCKDCNTTFYESFDWLHPTIHITMALYYHIIFELTKLYSISDIADRCGIPECIIYAVLDTIYVDPPVTLPETLGIDEFKGTSGEWQKEKGCWDINRFHCNIADGDAHCTIDVLPQIKPDFVKSLL